MVLGDDDDSESVGVLGGLQCPSEDGAAAPLSVAGPSGGFPLLNTPYLTGQVRREPVFAVNGKKVDITSLGQVMKFKDSNFGVFGPICGIKCPLDGKHAAVLCLHCVVEGYGSGVELDERGKAVPPAKHKTKPMPFPWIYLSHGKSSKFLAHWKLFHGRRSLTDRLPRQEQKKRRHSVITTHLASDGAKYQERALMVLYSTTLRMSFRTAVEAVIQARVFQRGQPATAERQMQRLLVRDIDSMTAQLLGGIAVKFVNDSIGMAGFTADGWTDTTQKAKFTALTMHFIDLQSKSLRNFTIACVKTVDGTAQSTAQALTAAWKRFITAGLAQCTDSAKRRRTGQRITQVRGLSKCCTGLVSDNASAMVAGVSRAVGRDKAVPCMMHTLELVTKAVVLDPIEFGDGDDLDVVVNRRGSHGVVQMRTLFTRVVAAARSITSAYRRSEQHFLKLPEGTKRFVTPTDTRWGSTYDCLARVVENLPALHAANTNGDLPNDNVHRWMSYVADHIAFVRAILAVLKVFRANGQALCADNSVTASHVIPALQRMYDMLTQRPADADDVAQFKTFVRSRMKQRFATLGVSHTQFDRLYGKVHDVFVTAMCLDPLTMWTLKGDQKTEARRKAARYLTSMQERMFPQEAARASTAADAAAVQREYTMDLPGDDDVALMASRPPVVIGGDEMAFEQSLRHLSSLTTTHFRECARKKRLEVKRPSMPVSVADVYGTAVNFWVTASAEFGPSSIFGQLFPYAMAILCVPATEEASERVFKAAKYAINADRPRLDSARGEQQVLVRRAIQARDLNASDIANMLRDEKYSHT